MSTGTNSKNSTPTLRASGKAPRADYVIVPAAGSLIGHLPELVDDKERTNAVAQRMLECSGARRSGGSNITRSDG